jgi:aspartyl aminopeptidase
MIFWIDFIDIERSMSISSDIDHSVNPPQFYTALS